MLAYVLYALLFLLISLVCGNNLSACTGSIISGRIVGRRTGIIIAIIGYSAGLVLQGSFLKHGLSALLPMQSELLVTISLGIAAIIFAVAYIIKVPQALSIVFAMTIIGMDLGSGNAFNTTFVWEMILFWIFSSVAAAALTIVLMRFLYKRVRKRRIWRTISIIKMLLVVISFMTAFALGANTLGFIYYSTSSVVKDAYGIPIAILGIIVGSLLLSEAGLRRLGNEILPVRYLNALVSQAVSMFMLEIATLASIPTSNSQTFTASLYGAGISYRIRLIPKKTFLIIIYSWIFGALISFLSGYGIAFAIYHL